MIRRCSPLPATSSSQRNLCALRVSAFSSPNVDALDAASSISPLFATLTENTRGGEPPAPLSFHPERPTLNRLLDRCSTILPLFIGCQLSAVSSTLSRLFVFSPFKFRLSALFALLAVSPERRLEGSGVQGSTACPEGRRRVAPRFSPRPRLNSFIIRTYTKHTRNPFRIRTSKTQHLKPFRMNTYKKTGEGVPSLIFSERLCDLSVSPLSLSPYRQECNRHQSAGRVLPEPFATRPGLLTTLYSLLTVHSLLLGRPPHPAAVADSARLAETQTPASSPSTHRPTIRFAHKSAGKPIPCRLSSSAVRPSPCFRRRRRRAAALSARSLHRAGSRAAC
jgi:hypothetical protein